MKLKTYLENLTKQAFQNPEILEYEVIYASDDEGNRYEPVKYNPTVGRFKDDTFDAERSDHNAICVN